MRRFLDSSGRPWDVVLGRESWGSLLALFVPAGVGRTEPVRQSMLSAASYEAAQAELDTLTDAELRNLFETSTPKES